MVKKYFKRTFAFVAAIVVLMFVSVFSNSAEAGLPSCVSGYSYNQAINKCEADPLCPWGGIYDAAGNHCVAEPTYTCNVSGYSYDQGLDTCVKAAVCCAGSLVIAPYQTYCDEGHPRPCSCEGYGGTDQQGHGICIGAPDCDGGILSGGTGTCVSGKTVTCPSGYAYYATQRECYKYPPDCPSGGGYYPSHDKCISNVITDEDDDCGLGVGQPVNVASGAVYLSITDFSFKGIMPVNFTRYYNSKGTLSSGFGYQWSSNFDTRVTSLPNKLYKVLNPDGSIYYYNDTDVTNDTNGDIVYEADIPRGVTSWLIKHQDGTFTRGFKEGEKEEFSTAGYLMAMVDRNDNRITLTRDSSNRLTKITDASGKEINITNAPGKINSMTLPDGKQYTYTYLSSGYLSTVTYPDGNKLTYQYIYIPAVASYRLTGIKNEKGNYIEKHTYDSQGRALTSSKDGINELLTINYMSDMQSTVTDSLGRVTTYNFERSGGKNHVTSIVGPGCISCGQGDTSKTYDNNLHVTSQTDASGNITVMTYDEMGNMLTRTEAYGTVQQRTTTYTFNEFGEVLTETDNDGILTNYTYDTSGNMLTKTEAYGTADKRTTTYTYNAYGQLLITSDPGGNTTTNTYDQYGNLASVTNALNQTITYAYDIMGNLQSKTDANGRTTTYEYDPRDRLIRETKPDGGVINYEYDLAGNRTAVVDVNGNRTTFNYDTINRLIKITDAEGNSINYTYDTEANMTSMTIRDSAGNIKTLETYTYDDRNRLTRTTHLDGTYTEQGYDAVGNVITKRDENGNVTRNTYDALKRLQSVTDPNGGITSYTYDVRNNLTFITDANGNITTYTYDSLNRLISTISPDTGTTIYTYDDNGNMLAKTDANGVITTYVYDALNRQISAQFPDPAQNIEYYYDDTQAQNGIGRSTSMTDQSGTTWYDRDTMGRVIKETKQIDSVIYRTEYSYDLNGNVLTMTYPGGRKITYTHNNLNKVTSVTDTYLGVPRTLASNIVYQPFGDMASMTQGNGIATTKTYDSRNQLNGLNVGALKQHSYSRDNVSNITTITDALNPATNKTFTYDTLSRLTIATGPWGAITYAYDAVGNRTYETTDTGTTTYNYTINTNKLGSSTGEKAIAFNYDNNGNAVSENSRQYIYNQNQRMTQVTDAGAVLEEYVYNGKGQRVKKCTDNGTRCTVYHYDQNGSLTAESTSSGTVTAEYVYLNGNPLAKINSMVSGAAYNYPDPVGSPGFRASLSLNVNSSSLSTGYIKYVFKRMFLTNTSTTGLLVTGNTATVTGIGTVNNIILGVKETIPGCTITATITDGSPDAMGIEIRKPDGTLYYSAGTQSVASGNYTFGDNIYYYHNDHLGTPMIMTDSSGGIVWQGEFKPFGEPVSVSGSISNNFRFPGQYFDSKTGLHQNWFRDYKPEIGRYVEADPILQPMIDYKIASIGCSKIGLKPIWRVPSLIYNPQDLHPYIYAKENPENLVDPTGLICGTKWVDWIIPDNYGKYNFVRPCTNHDKCYGCEGKIANKSKTDCDRDFLRDMKEECKRLSGYWHYDCMLASHVYYGFVATLGGDAYGNARKEKCCK